MSTPQQGANETPKTPTPASPQHQSQTAPKPDDKQPSPQQK
jgi:hypothetical protein